MSEFGLFGTGNLLGILSTTLLIASIYFTFTFFEHLKSGENRLRKQSKIAALICLTGALMIPAFYSIYVNYEMMK
ncbi:hypothetical protein GPDM_02280 [Planococcus donghaensis MPA1U2]|uniref:Uncharacterized protein n=1 Tax=Planococcus donghaensis MPA1U2 TaxID=933115 RepID=E7RDC8_9BACL|nr:hypothetical protein GPDM_02280 [Planococcus donghaensis MPA1U2]